MSHLLKANLTHTHAPQATSLTFRPIRHLTMNADSTSLGDFFCQSEAMRSVPDSRDKTLEGARNSFYRALGNLRELNEDDRAAVGGMVRLVRGREDLNSRQKEYLIAHEVMSYGAENVMKMTGWETQGQPWTAGQQNRFDALTTSFQAARELSSSLTHQLKGTDPLAAHVQVSALAASATDDDPLVRMAKKRRKQAEEIFTMFKEYMAQVSKWRMEIWQMRRESALAIIGLYGSYLGQSWRKKEEKKAGA